MKKALAILAVSGLALAASADVLVINIGGWQADGGYTNAGNTFQDFNLGVGTTIDSASFDVSWTAASPSWRSELALSLNDDLFGDFYDAFPSDLDSAGSDSRSGDFAAAVGGFIGGPFTLTSGILHVEIYDTFADAVIDQVITSGTITVNYTPIPAPGSVALLGLAGFAARRRRA